MTSLKVVRQLVRNGRYNKAITFPVHITDALGLEVGDAMEIEFRKNGTIVLRPLKKTLPFNPQDFMDSAGYLPVLPAIPEHEIDTEIQKTQRRLAEIRGAREYLARKA